MVKIGGRSIAARSVDVRIVVFAVAGPYVQPADGALGADVHITVGT